MCMAVVLFPPLISTACNHRPTELPGGFMISYQLDWLNRWHATQKTSSTRGVELEALSDGSWKLSVPLDQSAVSARPFSPVKVRRTETNWLQCKIEENEFQATAGPRNLAEALNILRKWSDESKEQEPENKAA